jgi:hypothetical protein
VEDDERNRGNKLDATDTSPTKLRYIGNPTDGVRWRFIPARLHGELGKPVLGCNAFMATNAVR